MPDAPDLRAAAQAVTAAFGPIDDLEALTLPESCARSIVALRAALAAEATEPPPDDDDELGPLTPQGAERCQAKSPQGMPCVLPVGHEIRHAAPKRIVGRKAIRERWDDPGPAPDPQGADDRCRVSENGSVFHRWACDFGPDCPAPGGVMHDPQGADEPKRDAHGFTDAEHDTLIVLIDRNAKRVQQMLTLRAAAGGGGPDEPGDDDPVTVLSGLLDHAVQSWSPRGTGSGPMLAEWDDTDWADSGWTDAERVELRAAIDRVRPEEEDESDG